MTKELKAGVHCLDNTEGAIEALTQRALNILIKTNPLIVVHGYLEELATDYCSKNIAASIKEDIRTHICNSQEFNLDGYALFGMKEYSARINDFLMYVLKQIAVKDRRDTLISELRNYVAKSKPGIAAIYLEDAHGYYEMFDETRNRLTDKAIIAYTKEYGIGDGFEPSDIVMNYLLKTMPRKIYLQANEKPNTFIRTLSLVFGDRIFYLKING